MTLPGRIESTIGCVTITGARRPMTSAVQMMKEAHQASDHDVKIGTKLAWIVCGGDVSARQDVTEQHLLDLEREAFLSLCGEQKTQERIQFMLMNNKPLRN